MDKGRFKQAVKTDETYRSENTAIPITLCKARGNNNFT